MAVAAKRSSANTDLVIGSVRIPIGLFGVSAKPGGVAEFTTAGPNGGVLVAAEQVKEAPLPEGAPMPELGTSARDAFADPGSDAPPVGDSAAPAADPSAAMAAATTGAVVPGRFGRVLIEEGSGVEVAPEDVRRGVRLEDGNFVDCTDELQAIVDETKLDQMTVVSFIDVGQVEAARVTDAYYVGAMEPFSAKPLRMILEAMRINRRCAVVKWSSRSRQSLGVLKYHGRSGTMVLLKLAWSEDFREAPAKAKAVTSVAVTAEEIRLAADLVIAMGAKVETLDELRDDAIARREELHEAALAGEVDQVKVPPAKDSSGAAADFEAALAELLDPAAGKV